MSLWWKCCVLCCWANRRPYRQCKTASGHRHTPKTFKDNKTRRLNINKHHRGRSQYHSDYNVSFDHKQVEVISCNTSHNLAALSLFTRTWLCYARVFAIANLSVCLSSVAFVCPIQMVEICGNISSPLCALAILWPLCKILWRSSQGNPSIKGTKHMRGSKIE